MFKDNKNKKDCTLALTEASILAEILRMAGIRFADTARAIRFKIEFDYK